MSDPAPPSAPTPAPTLPPSVDALEPRCANCGAALFDRYCAQCGQQVRDLDPDVHELFREGWEEFTSVDGKLLRTLRMLVTGPGRLTNEYFAGRRASYVAPLKLYLWLSVVYFFASAMVPGDRPAARLTGVGPTRTDTIDARAALDSVATAISRDSTRSGASRTLGAALRRAAAHEDDFKASIKRWVPRAIFTLVPIAALLLGLVYRSRGLRYPRHLAFAFHVHAFVFALLLAKTLVEALRLGDVVEVILSVAVMTVVPAYGLLAMRRVYGGRLGATIGRALLLLALYLPLFAVAMGLSLVAALLTF